MPIEWDDGTACELHPQTQESLDRGEESRSFYLVRSAHEPRGWNRSTMPRLGLTKPISIDPDGTPDCARMSGAPRVVNTQMPILRFPDGTEPVKGNITNDGTSLILYDHKGNRHSYTYPRLVPVAGAKLVVITPAMIVAEEKAVEEQEAMFDNPLFGAF